MEGLIPTCGALAGLEVEIGCEGREDQIEEAQQFGVKQVPIDQQEISHDHNH